MQPAKDKEYQFVDESGEPCSPDSLLLFKLNKTTTNIKLPLLNPYENSSLSKDVLKINEINLLSANINSLNLFIISSLNKSQIYKTIKEEIMNRILSAYLNFSSSLTMSDNSLESRINLLREFREKTFATSSYFNDFVFNKNKKVIQNKMKKDFEKSSDAVCNTQVIDFSSVSHNVSSEA